MNAIESLKLSIDSVLGVRASIGAALHRVYLVTRTWSGTQVGDGQVSEECSEVLPTPGIKDYSHSLRVTEGGNIKQGDLIIEQISKNKYPTESDVDCSSDETTVERMYKIGDFYYRVISVVEKQVTWNVQVRRLSDQTRRG